MPVRPRLTVTAVRRAQPDDLADLAGIESAAATGFSALMDTTSWPAPPTGAERAATPASAVLVVGEPALGFAHIVGLDQAAHLAEISVHPAAQGQGIGDMLLAAALGVALDAGHPELTLTTFAELPWNGPWYARRGFREVTAQSRPDVWARMAPVLAAEEGSGLSRGGRRIAMARDLLDQPVPIPAVSVLPLREGPDGLQAFVQFRVATMDFAAGAVVFPGGRIDPGDRGGAALLAPQRLAAHVRAWRHTGFEALAADPSAAAATLVATGVREVREETGADLDAAALIPWDNWITPIASRKRFDVYFFVAPVGAAQAPQWRHTTTEAHRSEWVALAALAAGAESGELLLLPPTRTLVDELLALGSLAAIRRLIPRIRAVRHDLDDPRPRATDDLRVPAAARFAAGTTPSGI